MWYEIARELIRKVIHDKILLALVVFGVIAFFMNGMVSNNEPAPTADNHEASASTTSTQSSETSTEKLEPNLACDFLKWWMTSAMDYSPRTCQQSHNSALAWMSPQASATFQQSFWPPALADSISSGKITATFQPQSIQAEAVNPDGTVVVGLTGTLVYQQGGSPISNQIMTEFLIRKERNGLRVAGLYNHQAPIPSSSPY